MQCNGVPYAPEDGPAGKADLQIVSEVEGHLLAVEPGPCGIGMSGEFAQDDIEAICAKRGKEREWMGAGRDEAQVIRRLGVAGECERPHGRWSPVELLFAKGEGVSGEGDAAIEFDRAMTIICSAAAIGWICGSESGSIDPIC